MGDEHPLAAVVAGWQKKTQNQHFQEMLDNYVAASKLANMNHPCPECEKLKGHIAILKENLETVSGRRDFVMERNRKDYAEIESLKKELADLKAEKKSPTEVRKPFICPMCNEGVDTFWEHLIHRTGVSVFHKQCWYDTAKSRKLARLRRRARMWRNFKLFLSNAFWSVW